MIKLLALLFGFSLTYGEAADYLLPNDNALFSHALEKNLNLSAGTIFVLTPSLHHSALKHAAIKGIAKGARLILIVQTIKGDPISLAQYERTDIRTLDGRPLEGSILLIDNRFGCIIPGSIDQKKLVEHTSLIHCTDDERELVSLHKTLLPILHRSQPYLK